LISTPTSAPAVSNIPKASRCNWWCCSNAARHLYETLLSDDQQIVDEGDGRARLSATVNDVALVVGG